MSTNTDPKKNLLSPDQVIAGAQPTSATRLIETRSGGSDAIVEDETASSASTGKLPAPPDRRDFHNQSHFEEAIGRWHETVGRIKAMADAAQRAKASRAPAEPPQEVGDRRVSEIKA